MSRKSYIPRNYQTKRASSKKSQNSWGLYLGVAISFMLLVGTIYIIYSGRLNIQQVKVESTNETLAQNLIMRVEDYLTFQTTWWFNSKSIFLVPISDLEAYLLTKFPEIQKISIQRHFDLSLSLRPIPRVALLDICENELCFRVGEDGVVMQKLDQNSSSDLVKLTGLKLPEIGQSMLSEREMQWLRTIIQTYNNIDNLKVESIAVKQSSGNLLAEVFVYTKEGYYIILDLETDVVYQAEVLKTAFNSQISPEIILNLQYIDLRILNRVYYSQKE